MKIDILMMSILVGCYFGLFVSFFFQIAEIHGTSMSVNGEYKNCYSLIRRTQDISGKADEDVCFRVSWTDDQVCHRCQILDKQTLDYQYLCWGDNAKSSVDYIRKSDIYGVVLTEVCR
jgi:hypothetical protein